MKVNGSIHVIPGEYVSLCGEQRLGAEIEARMLNVHVEMSNQPTIIELPIVNPSGVAIAK